MASLEVGSSTNDEAGTKVGPIVKDDKKAAEATASKPGVVITRTGDGPTPIDFLFQSPGGEDASPKEKAFLRKLDAFFDAHGLRPISKRMVKRIV
jgi:hypothetical protein